MPRPRNKIPALYHNRRKNLGFVRLDGTKETYLPGKWPADQQEPPPEVRKAYNQLIAEWLHNDGILPAKPAPKSQRKTPANRNQSDGIVVAELIERYLRFADGYYRDADGVSTGEIENLRAALRPLNHLFGDEPAADFGPKKFKQLQELLVAGYRHPEHGPCPPLSRSGVNGRTARVKRLFRWGVSEELVPPGVYHGLLAVRGLARGRTSARETDPVAPVAVEVVSATLPHLRPVVAAMVRLQLYSAMRPGEVCRLTPNQMDRSGEVWIYSPVKHKNRHHGRTRRVFLGPKAQAVLWEFLRIRCPFCKREGRPCRLDSPDGARCRECARQHDRKGIEGPFPRMECHHVSEPLFSPARDREERFEDKRKGRKTRVQPSQRCRKKKKPRRLPGIKYTTASYNQSVVRACRDAGVSPWNVNRLRHTQATTIRRIFGLEASQVALGHSKADVTQIYAERDETLAIEVAKKLG